jgi:hypothetical protein
LWRRCAWIYPGYVRHSSKPTSNSLTSGEPHHPDFDIDLALDGGDVYAAEEIAASCPFEVDVVSLALLPEETRRRIRERGEVMYARE